MQENLANAVAVYDGQPCTTSLKIAEVFGKQHRNVLQAIRDLEAPADFAQLNFKRGTYLDANQQERPMFHITRDGFTLLAMGFTGKAAMRFKVAYIEAFNAMEQQLRAQVPALPDKRLLRKITAHYFSFGSLQRRRRGPVPVFPGIRTHASASFITLSLGTPEEQRQRSGTGMRADHRSDIGNDLHVFAVFLFQDLLQLFRVFHAVCLGDEDR